MTDLWAVLGLACIDPGFRTSMFDGGDMKTELDEYNFRLSNYELGEVIRIFRGSQAKAFQEVLTNHVEGFVWKNRIGACLTGISGYGYIPLTPDDLEDLQAAKSEE